METIDIVKLVGSIKSGDTWIVILSVAIAGIVGGLAHKLTSPPEDKTSLPGYVVVGAVSALAVLFVFAPADAVRLVALSLAAGYGGKAILNALEARVVTALARAETARAKEEGAKAVEAGKEAVQHAQALLRINEQFDRALREPSEQPREAALASLKTRLSEFAIQPAKDISGELQKLEARLNFYGEWFRK